MLLDCVALDFGRFGVGIKDFVLAVAADRSGGGGGGLAATSGCCRDLRIGQNGGNPR